MAALVQTLPQQTASVTMLQSRPSSTIITTGQPRGSQQYLANPQAGRSAYHAATSPSYRASLAPVQPYAFTSTSNLNQALPWHPQSAYRTTSSPAAKGASMPDQNLFYRAPVPTLSTQPSPAFDRQAPVFGISHRGSRDDSSLSALRGQLPVSRPHSQLSVNIQPTFVSAAPTRNTPDRYRRQSAGASHHARSQSATLPSALSMPNLNHVHAGHGSPKHAAAASPRPQAPPLIASLDDMQLCRRPLLDTDAKSMRRRSMHNMEIAGTSPVVWPAPDPQPVAPRRISRGAHSHHGSTDSIASSQSSHSRSSSATNRNSQVVSKSRSFTSSTEESTAKSESPKPNSSPRGLTSEAAKRTLSPSPLSKPATVPNDPNEDSLPSNDTSAGSPPAAAASASSAAAKQLAAINQKGAKAKSKTSRLRRAFSFGSAADFRKAAGGDEPDRVDPTKLSQKPENEETYDSEQARIAEAQEAGGIGNSIYGGRFFGSTDDVSISSTASSTSVMIRKMGRGMKKGTRSLVGLFRPKSIGAPSAADTQSPDGSQATVSMITVEAESQRVNVNPDPSAAGGVTGFPHLERNSVDATTTESAPGLGSDARDLDAPAGTARKSIVGGDKERAEVLAAVRKGILKRSGSSSPSLRPTDLSLAFTLPNIPAIADSPSSTPPSTPHDEAQGHKRTSSIAIGADDYVSALRLGHEEYDRRGEIATCNRLTPMLAQQIKEELNTFKMEMEVHENSKIYTHFF